MDDICEEGWHRGFEGEYEIHVRSRPAVTNDSERNAAFGYDVKILPPGAEPASPAAWVEFSSGEGIQFQTKGEALDAGVASARKRIFGEFGEPDIPSEPRSG